MGFGHPLCETACDIRSDDCELLEDGVEDAEATRRVVGEYEHLDADEDHVLSLALAAAQVSLGRLDDITKRGPYDPQRRALI
ncbi:MAG: hypothetical protein WAV00_05665 [Nocardioides sp.]